ncbi:MAG: DUF3105 domain-containing protein [Solirubrobacterales bacterium]
MPGTARFLFAAVACVAVTTLAACGGDDEPTVATSTTTSTTSTTSTTGATGTGDAAAAAGGSAFIDLGTGDASGLEPDDRQGTAPPEQETDDLEQAADDAACQLELDLKDEGNEHIPAKEEAEYDTAPPTSGSHDAVPLADGAYLDTPQPRYFVHSLEHGRVVILYQPDLPEEDQLALKGAFEEDPDGMILTPYPDMPYQVAAAAWTNFVGCGLYDGGVLDVVRSFRDEFRGNGPEAVPL